MPGRSLILRVMVLRNDKGLVSILLCTCATAAGAPGPIGFRATVARSPCSLLLQHKDALFSHLMARWRALFSANFDVLLYDLTSTYFEINASDLAEGDKRRHGYSRDKRPDCPQVVIALVVTPDGLPLAYEVLPGNTADCTTLRMFLARIERQYGRARRVWVMICAVLSYVDCGLIGGRLGCAWGRTFST